MIYESSEIAPERNRLGLTLDELSRVSRVSARVIGKVEKVGCASERTLKKLTDALLKARGGGELRAKLDSLEAEIAALRARAVPEIVWNENTSKVGAFTLDVPQAPGGWVWRIWWHGALVSSVGMTGGTMDQAKANCEAAFLRMVGCK